MAEKLRALPGRPVALFALTPRRIAVASITVNSATSATAALNIDPAAAIGASNVTLTTGTEVVTLSNGFAVTPGAPVLVSASPNSGQQGQQNLSVNITGQFTHFVQGTTTVSFGLGTTVNSTTITDATHLTAQITIDFAAGLGARTVVVTTGSEQVSLPNGFTVNPSCGPLAPPPLWQALFADDFNRPDGAIGNGWSSFGNGASITGGQLATIGGLPNGGASRMLSTSFPVSFSFGFRTNAPSDGGWFIGFKSSQPDPGCPGPASSSDTNCPEAGYFLSNSDNGMSAAVSYQTSSGPKYSYVPLPPGVRSFQTSVLAKITGIINADFSGTITVDYQDGVSPDPVSISFGPPAGALSIPQGSFLVLGNGDTASGPHYIANFLACELSATTATLSSVAPSLGLQGQTLTLHINGYQTPFQQSSTTVNAGPGITVSAITVNGPYNLTAQVTIDSTATLGPRTITVTTGSQVVSLANVFTVQSAGPVLALLSPNSSQQGQQGLSVSITGQNTNFVQGTTTASFGAGVTVASLTINSATTATAVLNIDPAAALGARDVTLTTGTEVATLSGGFAVTVFTIIVPTITSVSPNASPQGQGGPVAIAGLNTHFVQGTTQVDFGPGIAVSNINVACPTCLTVQLQIASGAAPGPRTVTVSTGTEVVSLAGGFTVLAGTPILTSLVPAAGQQGQTLPGVMITGQFTHFAQGTTQVSFGAEITVSNINVAGAASLTVQLAIDPNAAVGARTLTVTTGTEIVSVANVFTVQAATTPIVMSLSTGSGQQGQTGLSVTITGLSTHFVQGTSQASFGAGVTVVSLAVSSPTVATAVVNIDPAAAVGPRTVSVTTNTEVASFTNGFTITAGTPSILSLNPNTAQQSQQNLSIAVTGQLTHFAQGTTQASFGAGISIVSLTVTSPTTASVVVNVDPAAAIGLRDVTLTTGAEVVTLAGGFVVNGGPTITVINPNSGQQGQQNLSVAITVQSTHFAQGTTQASFGAGITVVSLTINSPTSATAVLSVSPSATLGLRTVSFTTGTETASAANSFSVTAGTPVITQVSPNTSRQAQQNLTVTITGQFTNFAQGTSQVSFGGSGVTVATVTVNSSTSLTAQISIAVNALLGSRPVTVTTGTEVAILANAFSVTVAVNQPRSSPSRPHGQTRCRTRSRLRTASPMTACRSEAVSQ